MTEDGIPLVPYHGNYYYAHIVDQQLVASAVWHIIRTKTRP